MGGLENEPYTWCWASRTFTQETVQREKLKRAVIHNFNRKVVNGDVTLDGVDVKHNPYSVHLNSTGGLIDERK